MFGTGLKISLTALAAALVLSACGDDPTAPGIPDVGGLGGGNKNNAACELDMDCGEGQFCDTAEKVCKDQLSGGSCTGDLECPAEEQCVGGICTPRSAGEDASTGDAPSADAGPECTSNNDCANGLVCDPKSQKCVSGGDKTIEVNPKDIVFGSVAFGAAVTREITIRNSGTSDLTIFDVAFDSSTNKNVFKFVQQPGKNLVLKGGETAKVEISYTPDDGVPDTGAVDIINDSSNSPKVSVPMATEFKGKPDLRLFDSASGADYAHPQDGYKNLVFNFGDVKGGDSKSMSFLIKNAGDGNAILSINGFALSGRSAQDFTVKAAKPDPLFLNPGEQVQVDLTYTPARDESDEAILAIKSNDTDANQDGTPGDTELSITLKGRAGFVPPGLEISRTAIDFGDVQLIKTPNNKPGLEKVILSNTGGAVLTLDTSKSGLVIPQTPFTVSNLPANIPPRGNVEIQITYEPKDLGNPNANQLKLVSDDPNRPEVTIDLKANPVDPEMKILTIDKVETDLKLDFEEVQRISGKKTLAVKIKNDTPRGTLTLTEVNLVGSSTFKILNPPSLPATVAANAEVVIEVEFAPPDIQEYTATLQVRSNDADNPKADIQVVGKGFEQFDNETLDVTMSASTGGQIIIITDNRDVDLFLQKDLFKCPPSSNWGVFGRCTHTANSNNSESISHTYTEASDKGDGSYNLRIFYKEDCKTSIGGTICFDSGSIEVTLQLVATSKESGKVNAKSYTVNLGKKNAEKIVPLTRKNGKWTLPNFIP